MVISLKLFIQKIDKLIRQKLCIIHTTFLFSVMIMWGLFTNNFFFSFMIRRPLISTLFLSTTLFLSVIHTKFGLPGVKLFEVLQNDLHSDVKFVRGIHNKFSPLGGKTVRVIHTKFEFLGVDVCGKPFKPNYPCEKGLTVVHIKFNITDTWIQVNIN